MMEPTGWGGLMWLLLGPWRGERRPRGTYPSLILEVFLDASGCRCALYNLHLWGQEGQ